PKSSESRSLPESPGEPDGANGQPAQHLATGAQGAATAGSQRLSQIESFGEGMRLFHARQLGAARELFLAASSRPDRSVSHRAALHARMCESRLESTSLLLNTPEDHYNYAVTLINSRNFAVAQQHLLAALEVDPAADHVLYALAACQGL